MATIQEQTELLDRLQAEVNRVLEQTGRLFAAAHNSTKASAAAQAYKLKHDLPGSVKRFHTSLDQLEDQLHLAKTVMRRDLAISREKAHPPTEPEMNGQMEEPRNIDDAKIDADAEPTQTAKIEAPEIKEVEMQDDPPAPQSDETSPNHDANNTQASSKVEEDEKPQDQSPVPAPMTTADPEPDNPSTETTEAPAADLESLFNEDSTFDFEALTNNDNNNNNNNNGNNDDDIASLLPGLQDYANTQPDGTGEPDFNALFGPPTTSGEDQQAQQATTMDGLMDFGAFEFDGNGSGEGDGQDFDFSFD